MIYITIAFFIEIIALLVQTFVKNDIMRNQKLVKSFADTAKNPRSWWDSARASDDH